ncbi:unnamed protein product [Linum tenue]|uniref:Major facilitator superfamily (MFS) profile domain-containing protein n=1 Tax=Linum tenue TaxID=586396 RepID=A0AAV0JZJ3_9ROSI|nr:unnamed protein product [Linum tenue]
MAGGGYVPDSGTKQFQGRVTGFVLIACIVAACGGLIFGYDIGISGGVTSMDSFLSKFFPSVYRKEKEGHHESMYCKFDSHLLTLFTSSLYLAALFASAVAAYVTKVFGRKISMLFGGIVFLAGAILNGVAVDVAMLIVGRLLLGVGVGFANQVLVAVMIAKAFGSAGVGVMSKADSLLVLILICFYVAAFAWSWGPLGWLVPSEICPLEIRSAGQAINVAVNMAFTFIIGQFFLTMLCHMKFGLFLFFACWVVVMTLFIYFFLPETKNVPIEEMNNVWRKHWFWGQYIPDDAVIGTASSTKIKDMEA